MSDSASAERRSQIVADVDFGRDGKQAGNLSMPWSSHESAYGQIQIPIVVVKNGDGPTMLYTAGTHGDEYEGQVALMRLARELEPANVCGRVVIVPALNYPAAEAGRRTSPIDQGNLNRAYPGDPDGGPTAQIAWYMSTVLLKLATGYHDLHSGGSSLEYLEYAGLMLCGDKDLDRRGLDLLQAFAPPIGVVRKARDGRAAQPAAHRLGVAALGGEFGGRGGLSRHGLGIIEAGLRNQLKHLGILPGWNPPKPAAPTRLMTWTGREGFVYAPAPGVFEPLADLGEEVEAGQPAGLLHFIDEPTRAPLELRFAVPGMVICRRAPARCRRGDCLAHLAVPWNG
ncbi:MAG: hypothetical protein FJX60_06390 [Alphaproteobacteria bacterium]|nr:hypothetical protein [Alphaproteobacteria bacterium]